MSQNKGLAIQSKIAHSRKALGFEGPSSLHVQCDTWNGNKITYPTKSSENHRLILVPAIGDM